MWPFKSHQPEQKSLSNTEYIQQVQHIVHAAWELCRVDLNILQFLPDNEDLEALIERLAEAGQATELIYKLSEYERIKAQIYYVRRVVDEIGKLRGRIEVVLEDLDADSIFL